MDKEMDKEKLGLWLKEQRERKGLQVSDIIARTRYTKSHISKIENGKLKTVPLHTVRKMVRAVGGTMVEALVVAGVIPGSEVDVEGAQVLSSYKNIDTEMRPLAVNILDVIRGRHPNKGVVASENSEERPTQKEVEVKDSGTPRKARQRRRHK